MDSALLGNLHRLDPLADLRHARRVTTLALRLARLTDADVPEADLATTFHDLGKVHLADLARPFTPDECAQMEPHATAGEALLRQIPRVTRTARLGVLHHHERWDGRGDPNGQQGATIPLVARLVAALDVHDALTHPRPDRGPWTCTRALASIQREAGRHFDPTSPWRSSSAPFLHADAQAVGA